MRSDRLATVTSLNCHAGNETEVCEHHGEFAQRVTRILGKEFRTGCPDCSSLRKQAEADAERAEEARQKQEALERRIGSALIPRRFIGKTFSGYRAEGADQARNLAKCQGYANDFRENLAAGRCLILTGRPGTGKTHLAAAIADQLIRETRFVPMYRTVSGILQYIKGSFDNRATYSEAEAFESLTRPHLLIIDEVGATKPTEFELATLFGVINGRYEQQLPTIVISNLMPTELAGAIGERCLDRLREGGGVALIFDWASARSGITGGAAS
jgi:DNA replication protein DnaC